MGKINIDGTCAVLLTSYNGALFLPQQIKSIKKQTYSNIKIFVSDDGSQDATLQILEQESLQWAPENFYILDGPKKGFGANFMSLICNESISADYFAFCDQDDIWEEDKIKKAITILKEIPEDTPALYCSRTRLIDDTGKDLGLSPLFKKTPSFKNALVQCIAGGNTMVLNKAARNLLSAAKNAQIYSHDWWAYLLITGAGGKVIYDSAPSMCYRQHTKNVLGRNNNFWGRLHRIRLLLKGNFYNWNTKNLIALNQYRNLLTFENQKILDIFIAVREKNLLPRLIGMRKSGIYRQTFLGNCGIFFALICKKL